MRVTHSMMSMRLTHNIGSSFARLDQLQNQLSTGNKINRPGDDPIGIGYIMRYDSELNRNAEFLTNVDYGLGWLREMDTMLNESMNVLQRARVLTQQGATGTTDEQGRIAIAKELLQLKDHLVEIGNATFNGRYIFNGQKTDQPPYSKDTPEADATHPGVVAVNGSPHGAVPISITGEDIFGPANGENVFRILNDIIAALENGDQDEVLNGIGRLDDAMDRISEQWSETGARMNRLELIKDRLLDQNINLQQLRAEVNDVDMAEAIMQLKMQESVYMAALATGARLLNVSLIDFLR